MRRLATVAPGAVPAFRPTLKAVPFVQLTERLLVAETSKSVALGVYDPKARLVAATLQLDSTVAVTSKLPETAAPIADPAPARMAATAAERINLFMSTPYKRKRK